MIFDLIGLTGLAYWYALYPVHRLVFAGVLRGIVFPASWTPFGGVRVA